MERKDFLRHDPAPVLTKLESRSIIPEHRQHKPDPVELRAVYSRSGLFIRAQGCLFALRAVFYQLLYTRT